MFGENKGYNNKCDDGRIDWKNRGAKKICYDRYGTWIR